MPTVDVPLSKEYEAHEQKFKQLVLREPNYTDICMGGLGRPQEWQRTADGSAMLVTYPNVVDAYVQKILVEPGYECIGQLSAKDTLKLQEAVCDFFI